MPTSPAESLHANDQNMAHCHQSGIQIERERESFFFFAMTNTRGMRKWTSEQLLASNKDVFQDVCEVETCGGVGAGDRMLRPVTNPESCYAHVSL